MSSSSSSSSVSQRRYEHSHQPQNQQAFTQQHDYHDSVHRMSTTQNMVRNNKNTSYVTPPPPQQQNPPSSWSSSSSYNQHKRGGRNQNYYTSSQIIQTPLVLDPSSLSGHHPNSAASASLYYSAETRPPPTTTRKTSRRGGTVRKLLLGSGSSSSSLQQQTPPQQQQQEHSTPVPTAAVFARSAPCAGYLSKLGTNVPHFKRRFFVLKPSTHLYYFLSPTDTVPRGCIDLDQTTSSKTIVSDVEELPDGRVRFALQFSDTTLQQQQQQKQQRLVLEARSMEIAQQWMDSLNTERWSAVRNQVQEYKDKWSESQVQVQDLQRELESYKYIEQEKEQVQQDVDMYKRKLEQLNEGLRLLTQHLRRVPEEEEKETTDAGRNDDAGVNHDKNTNENDTNEGEAVTETDSPAPSDSKEEVEPETSVTDTPVQNTETPSAVPPGSTSHNRESSLLDTVSVDERPIEEIDIPGTHFAALTNVCQQLRENVRLASLEAGTAVEDLHAATEKVTATERRMAKAEGHICKLWEENCEIRKSLKQSKQEKRILVREVKNLQAREQSAVAQQQLDPPVSSHTSAAQTEETSLTVLRDEEERLIDEIEEHVISSIRLHEQFLGVNAGLGNELSKSVKKLEAGTYTEMSPARMDQTSDSDVTRRIENKDEIRLMNDPSVATSADNDSRVSGRMSPLRPKALSLFDENSDDDEDDESDDEAMESQSPSAVSSVGAEYGDSDSLDQRHHHAALPQSLPDAETASSAFNRLLEVSESEQSVSLESNCDDESISNREHPLLKLDEPDDAVPPHLCGSSTQSESSKSVVTDTGQATTRLACPLADVVETRRSTEDVAPAVREDGRVYHLSFYSRKIGLQFQKVPAEVSSRGLLTDAMTADLPSHAIKATGAETTAAELQRIAAISSRVTSSNGRHALTTTKQQEVLQVATPVDAVLICGFHGFEDTANRPKLGARLVAFDGISVEVGAWTFDSIRKAIKARGRPLTLSFRNDFLTTKQRSILTKAISEIQAALPPPHPALQYGHSKPTTSGSSVYSTQSHDTDQFVNDHYHRTQSEDEDMSVASSTFVRGFGRSFSTSHSVGGSSYHSTNYRSFSDANSSSVISATIAPLMSNLMTGLSKKRSKEEHAEDIPQYLRNDAESLQNTMYYDDFKSSLL